MRIRVCGIGKPRLAYAALGCQEYAQRLARSGRFEWITLREGTPQQESQRLLEASQGYLRVVLDERGKPLTTMALFQQFNQWEQQGTRGVAFLIGGANGHTPDLRQQAQLLLGLSAFTLQHELATLVLLEQLYRLETIRRGEPYHREG